MSIVVEAQDVTTEALAWPDRARAMTVTSAESYTGACEMLKGIKALRQKVSDTFDPHIKRAVDAHRALLAEKRDAEAPLSEAERILKDSIVAYDTAQDRLRREEERRLQEIARREEEQRRLEEAAALERQAAAADDVELRAEAEAMLSEPIHAPTVVVAKSTPKVAGISYRETWSARVVSLSKLIAWVARHPECANYLAANLPALNAAARAQKNGLRVDGVEAVVQKVAAATGR